MLSTNCYKSKLIFNYTHPEQSILHIVSCRSHIVLCSRTESSFLCTWCMLLWYFTQLIVWSQPIRWWYMRSNAKNVEGSGCDQRGSVFELHLISMQYWLYSDCNFVVFLRSLVGFSYLINRNCLKSMERSLMLS